MEFFSWPPNDKGNMLKRLQCSSYQSVHYRLLCVSAPPVARPMLKRWFDDLDQRAKGLLAGDSRVETASDVLAQNGDFLTLPLAINDFSLAQFEKVLKADLYFRFAVVCHPFKYAFSVWQSCLFVQGALQIGQDHTVEFLHRPINGERDVAIAFESFLEYLCSQDASAFSGISFTNQFNTLRPDLINYSVVVKEEEPSALSSALVEWAGEEAFTVFPSNCSARTLIPFSTSFITPRSAKLISTFYAQDFEVFGYSQHLSDESDEVSTGQMDISLAALRLFNENFQRLNERNANEYNQLKGELDRVLASRSLRITAPIRRLLSTMRQRQLDFLYAWIMKVADPFRIRRKLTRPWKLKLIQTSHLFDAAYYLKTYPDVQAAGIDPGVHYLRFGAAEQRSPSIEFDVHYYLNQNADVAQAKVNPLLHYLKFGQKEGRQIQAPPLALTVTQTNFVKSESLQQIRQEESVSQPPPLELAAVEETLEVLEVLEVVDAQVKSAQEIVERQIIDIEESMEFDQVFYLSSYPDLSSSMDLVRHYCEVGWLEGRDPSDDFSTNYYLEKYEDIRNARLNPFWHYIVAGAKESRLAVQPISTSLKDNIWFGYIRTDIQMLAFYKTPGWELLRKGQPAFQGHIQPILPDKALGFYDVLDPQVIRRQAELAVQHGIQGFCFEFDAGVPLALQPVGIVLQHDDIKIRFCVRVSMGEDADIDQFIEGLSRIFADRRHIKVDDCQFLLLENPDRKIKNSTLIDRLRAGLVASGNGEIYVVGLCGDVLTASGDTYDAVMAKPEGGESLEIGRFSPVSKNGVDVVPYHVISSQGLARLAKAGDAQCPVYHTVTLARDNTTKTPARPLVYTRFNTNEYRFWLDSAIANARAVHDEDRRFIFINAWNDWNAGLNLEPDKADGFSRLNEISRALLNQTSDTPTPKVSVIVPNYNHEDYLRLRLDSIYGQTYKNLEVILMDDCSRDGSREILDEYARNYPEITRTIYSEVNSGGVFRQWAKGIKAATGELVWVAESDDYCDNRFVETLVRCFDDDAVQLAYAKSVFVDKYEVPLRGGFESYLSDLPCASKWKESYVETAHNEVSQALGVKNTIPNASGVLFKRPVDMPLLSDKTWLSMAVAGDWVFYLHVLRGGKIAFRSDTTNFFRRYQGSAAERTYKKEIFYREVGLASRAVAGLYDVPVNVLEQCEAGYRTMYWNVVGHSDSEFDRWYDYASVLSARDNRQPTIMVSTMGFYPGGAEILPIRLANEFKRQGHSVLLLNTNLNAGEDGVRRMLRNDVPVVETSDVKEVRTIIKEFGIEALNSHQWHVQKYPLFVPDVFSGLRAHVASLHGMIEHRDVFHTTASQLRTADAAVTTWVYTADKNLVPFADSGLYDNSDRFTKVPNGLESRHVSPVPRDELGIPKDAFVLCCVSRAIPDKGWAELISAVELARELSGRDIRLILVGNGPVYDDYCREGVPHFVSLIGFSENSLGYYGAADMGIMLTTFKSESFPLTIVDCLFAGRPYIASDVGDIKNMLTGSNGVAGEVIPLDAWEVPIRQTALSIISFAVDDKKYSDAVALVADVASRYRIDAVAEQYVGLFNRDLNRAAMGESRVDIARLTGFSSPALVH